MTLVNGLFMTIEHDSISRYDLGDVHHFGRFVHVSKYTSNLPFWLFNLKRITRNI